jgi:fatty-acyl-CoA synthase
MRGYWKDSSGLDAEGWFHSGDLARVDEDGFYWVVGRSKDVIISGGENVHPAEIENVLADCPSIAEAAVVGVPDPTWGEVACAAIVKKKNVEIGEADVLQLFNDRLARYKHPRRVVFMDELPKNAMGKVRKPELRQLVAAR